MRRRISVVLIFIMLSLLLQFCGEKEETAESNSYYSTGSDAVSKLISDFDLGIKFNPPLGWGKKTTEISSKVETRGVYGGYLGKFTYQPSYVFFDDSTLSVLAMGKIIPPDSLKDGSNILNLYAQAVSSKQKNKQEYDVVQFEKDKVRFTLFTIKRANIVTKKLIFQNKFHDIIQFEYTSRASNISSEEEKIKQSIGSIKSL